MSTIKVNALQDTSGNGYYPAKTWVNLNGTGTVAIRANANVSSITDNGTGDTTVNFSNAFSSTNYTFQGNTGSGQNQFILNRVVNTNDSPTTSARRIKSMDTSNGGGRDDPYVYAVFI